MPAKYKLNDEHFFMLTFSTTPVDWPVDDLVSLLERLGCNYRVGRELHQDGQPHFHAMVCFETPFTDGDARATFTVGGRAPNIKVKRANPGRGWDYPGKYAGTKDGHYIVAEKGTRPGGDQDVANRPASDVWHEIISARTKEEFFDVVSRLAPRNLACNFTSLHAYAEWKYRPAVEVYTSPEGTFDVPDVLRDWVDDNLRGGFTGR